MAATRANSPIKSTEIKCKGITITTKPESVTMQIAMKECNRTKGDIYGATMKTELNWMAPVEVAQRLIVKDAKYLAYKKKCQEIDKRKAAKAKAKAK